jgi:hypothetical protein
MNEISASINAHMNAMQRRHEQAQRDAFFRRIGVAGTREIALKTLRLWLIPHIMNQCVEQLVNNLSDEFVTLNQSALRSANVAIVIAAVVRGNGLRIRD